MTTVSSTSSASAGRSAALAGIGFMLVATFLFALNSAVGQVAGRELSGRRVHADPQRVTLLLLSPVHLARRARPPSSTRRGPACRCCALCSRRRSRSRCSSGRCPYLPLADTTTFYLAGPIYVTALSVLLLGERVGWRRWTAVLIGFAGVVIALRPSSASFTLPALIALAGSISYALLMIMTRTLRETNDISADDDATSSALLAFGLVTAPFGWVAPDALRPCCSLPGSASRRCRGAVLRHPLAQARLRERGSAVSVHADRLVRGVRLADVR